MLVLERKIDQIITIGGDITIKVVDIQRGRVRLGITAPINMPIHRVDAQEREHGRSEDTV